MQAYQFLMNSVAFEEIEEVQLYYTGCGRETRRINSNPVFT